MSGFDKAIIEAIQSIGAGFLPIMKFFTKIGQGEAYFLIIIIVGWCWNYRLGIRLALLMTFTGAANGLLKASIHAPRPYAIDPDVIRHDSATRTASSFGMPSGHAQSVMTFWVYLINSHKHFAIWIIGTILIICIGISRIYLGSHSMSQVLAGWGIGLIIAIVAILLDYKCRKWFVRQSIIIQLASLLSFGGVLIFATFLTVFFQDTAGEVRLIARNHFLAVTRFSALFCGFAIGYVTLRKKNIQVRVAWWKQLIKLGIGIFSALIFMYIAEIPELLAENSVLLYLTTFLLYLLVALGAIYIAPLLFLKLGLVVEGNVDQVTEGDQQ